MASKQLLSWPDLKKSLKQLLKEYKEIEDLIVFGSVVRDKFNPQDVDIAVVVSKKNVALVGEVKEKIKNADVELVTPAEIYQSRLGLMLISEGFSIKNNQYLKEMMGIKPQKIYVYEIRHLPQTKKVLFGRGLNHIIKTVKAVKLGAGSVMVPIESSGSFEDFLNTWGLKYKGKEYLVL